MSSTTREGRPLPPLPAWTFELQPPKSRRLLNFPRPDSETPPQVKHRHFSSLVWKASSANESVPPTNPANDQARGSSTAYGRAGFRHWRLHSRFPRFRCIARGRLRKQKTDLRREGEERLCKYRSTQGSVFLTRIFAEILDLLPVCGPQANLKRILASFAFTESDTLPIVCGERFLYEVE